ncbi:isopentenyl-diphosphate Delta-isomerase [Propionicimonas sp.]|uniref:isopentenyl-diphosphate Delta-isomerase n=1 Tax=Propionicimonas sp. TaxID=1955623 RepID=UPI0039E2F4D5
MSTEVRDRVVLLDDDDRPVGEADRALVHGHDTPRHLAFSCYLFDAGGRVLLTRRALGKATWPGVWTNSCCGHPRPGEDGAAAVRRRLAEELGAIVDGLELALPGFGYRAVDASGIVENEACPVWVGRLSGALAPDPAEVVEIAWVAWPDLVAVARAVPALLSPWAALQVPLLDALPGVPG